MIVIGKITPEFFWKEINKPGIDKNNVVPFLNYYTSINKPRLENVSWFTFYNEAFRIICKFDKENLLKAYLSFKELESRGYWQKIL